MKIYYLFIYILFVVTAPLQIDAAAVRLGVDGMFTQENQPLLKGKRVGLITNHTAIDSQMKTTSDLFKKNANSYGYTLKALFAPEHGLNGVTRAGENVQDSKDKDGIPIYSLHGATRRPTDAMLKDIDLLVFDIQDIGSRSYTYISTLFYAMEEASKRSIPLIVLDRPNPINGWTVDGPMMEEKYRSFVGYINIPYCHALTIGELASFFNDEYKVGCKLTVIPMKGWRRTMSFADTGLPWVPTSPHVPEADTAFYYPTTGLLGELQMVSIGVGYTLPFKIVGAPWIDAPSFAAKLNEQKYPGVHFLPFYFRPFFGRFKQEDCQGVLIVITDPKIYLPVTTQFLLIGMLKTLYPQKFAEGLKESAPQLNFFNKITGTAEVYRIMKDEKYAAWLLRDLHQKERKDFIIKRKKYLTPSYQ